MKILDPISICILDLDKKVLRDIRKQLSLQRLDIPFTSHEHNLCSGKFDQEFDVVIAYLIIERCVDKASAVANLFASVAPNGILSTTYDQIIVPAGFVEIENGNYHRTAAIN